MASSKVMASSSTTNPDLPRQSSTLCSPLSSLLADLQSDPSKTLGSMSMDDLLKNLYSDQPNNLSAAAAATEDDFQSGGASLSREGSFAIPKDVGSKSVDEVWKEIVAGTDQRRGGAVEGITLEDFLTKAGAVREEEVRGAPVVGGAAGYGVDAAAAAAAAMNGQFQMQSEGVEGAMVVFGNGSEGRAVGAGRGKRRAVEEPVDKATQQKQRRMIKNRESAARSRERKQAYTVELESLVTQLEEENARLLREEAEQNNKRLKQLMENLIPVDEKRRPPRVLRRVNSMNW